MINKYVQRSCNNVIIEKYSILIVTNYSILVSRTLRGTMIIHQPCSIVESVPAPVGPFTKHCVLPLFIGKRLWTSVHIIKP